MEGRECSYHRHDELNFRRNSGTILVNNVNGCCRGKKIWNNVARSATDLLDRNILDGPRCSRSDLVTDPTNIVIQLRYWNLRQEPLHNILGVAADDATDHVICDLSLALADTSSNSVSSVAVLVSHAAETVLEVFDILCGGWRRITDGRSGRKQ